MKTRVIVVEPEAPEERARSERAYRRFMRQLALEGIANAPDVVVAYHAAGHAIAASVLGAGFRAVSVAPKRMGRGCIAARAGKGPPPGRYAGWGKALAVVALAGLETEQIRFRGARLGLDDPERAELAMEARHEESPVNWTAFRRRARRLILANWCPLHDVAMALVAGEVLSAADVRDAIEAYPVTERAATVGFTS